LPTKSVVDLKLPIPGLEILLLYENLTISSSEIPIFASKLG